MISYTLFSYTLSVPVTTNLFIITGGKHGYSGNLTGSNPWELDIIWDGTIINSASGSGAVTDAPNCFASVTQATAGSHSVAINWTCTSTYMTIKGSNLLILSAYK